MTEGTPVILIVDDNPSNLGLLFDLLDEKGFTVLTAKNGESALKRAESAHPDIILLDILMPPGIDGFETCRRLKARKQTRDIPVIFMTALSETVDKVKGFGLGAVDYIAKPFQPEEVLVRVDTHLTIQRLQNDLREALAHEKELNELKSRFLSMASHEFRTPLTSVLLASNLLSRYGDRMSAEKRVRECEIIENSVEHLNGMLDDVLMISKGEAGKIEFLPQPTGISALCWNLAERFKAMCADTQTFTFTPPDDAIEAVVDPKLLEHILSNLLSNAIKYSPDGGTITFEFLRDGEQLIFRVSDEGIGIPEADQQRLFETFHRGENVGTIKGTGLGLSIVKQFVEMHDGTISAESAENAGTRFQVAIPARR